MGDQWKNLDLSARLSLGFNKLSRFVLERKCTLALPDSFLGRDRRLRLCLVWCRVSIIHHSLPYNFPVTLLNMDTSE